MTDEISLVWRDCLQLLKPRYIETVWVTGDEPYEWIAELAANGFLPNSGFQPGYDAVVALFPGEQTSRREVLMSIDQMAEATKSGGTAFALFGAYDPEKNSFKDNELRAIFTPAFRIEIFRSYPGGLRGLLLRRRV